MSVYLCCPFDCQHKSIARNVFVDLNSAGIKTFYNGDIPHDMRMDDAVAGAISKAIQSPVFIPILCQGFTGGKSTRELAYAMLLERCVLPVIIDGHYITTEMRNLLGGTRIADLSTPAAYNTELPKLIAALRVMLPVLVANDQSAASAVSVEVESDENESEEDEDDEEDNDDDEEGNEDADGGNEDEPAMAVEDA